MADAMPDTVSIGEAADLVGVHRNTVRNRIKAGRYRAHKVVTAQGETYVIERASLDITPTNAAHTPSQPGVRHNPPNPSQAGAIVDEGQQAQQLAIVQQLLAPFIAELGATKVELGRTVERLMAVERERDDAIAEVEVLREIQQSSDETATMPYSASPEAPGREEPPAMTPNTLHEPSVVTAWWRRLVGRS